MVTVVRFAPSPTGYLHIGNTRTALINWLFAARDNGTFVLRLDDTDRKRSTEEYAEAIITDLDWLGINPHHIIRQSDRLESYEAAARKLRESGLLYPCYETHDELERQRKRRIARGLPPVYDRSALLINEKMQQTFEHEGRSPHWRFLLPNYKQDPALPERTEIHWNDVIRGPQTIDLASMSDPVLIRGDGSYLYTLPSVVDDMNMGISHVIRGDDHVTNSGAQIALFRALGANPPKFAHHNLLTTASGEGLSKRLGSLSLQGLRKDGYEPMAIASLATLIGTSNAVDALSCMESLLKRFDPTAITKSPAKFNVGELDNLNAKLIHHMAYETVCDRLKILNIDGGKLFWDAIRKNIDRVCEAKIWFDVIESATPHIEPENRDFLCQTRACLPPEPWDHNSWKLWIDALKAETGRKGRRLFMPLRQALTGHDHGPELDILLVLIGREKTLARLS